MAEALEGAVDQLEALDLADISVVDVDRAIAVDEDGSLCSSRFHSGAYLRTASNSAGDTVAVPAFATTSPAAWLAT